MKRYKFLVLALLIGALYVSCTEHEIALYDGAECINFHSSKIAHTFRDSDYVKGREWVELAVVVEIQGDVKKSRDFCLTTEVNSSYTDEAHVEAEDKYTYTALDTITQSVTIRAERPEKVTTQEPWGVNIVFDVNNPLHRFAPGREDRRACKVEIHYKIRPDGWLSFFWGKYSDGKYLFMMDVLRKAYREIPLIGSVILAEREKVRTAYTEYLKTNPPLLDEDGGEIVFDRQ